MLFFSSQSPFTVSPDSSAFLPPRDHTTALLQVATGRNTQSCFRNIPSRRFIDLFASTPPLDALTMTTRHPVKAHGPSRRPASAAATVARADTTLSIQPIFSIPKASPDARSCRSYPVPRSRTQDGSQDTSEEESLDRSCSSISYRYSVSDHGTPQSHKSELSRESVEHPQNMSDPIRGPDPRVFGPLQYNPLSYSEAYASQYYSPSAYSYYPAPQAYQYQTFAPYSAYSVTSTATSTNSSATVKPGSFSQGYPIEGGYMPESTFPGYDGAYTRPYHMGPYRHLQLYPPYQNLHLTTQPDGHAEYTLNEDTRRRHADPSRSSKSSAKTDEEKRRDMREAVLRKVEEDEARVRQSAHQSTASSDEHLTPPEYSRKSVPASRQRTEEEENRELRDAFRRRQEDHDVFPAWIKQQEAATDNGKRKEGFEAFVDVVLEKSELSGKRAASQGPPGEPNKETRKQETDDISGSQGAPAKLMRNAEESIVDGPTAKPAKFGKISIV